MSLNCPSCEYPIDEELPRLDEAKVLCPRCGEPLTLPEMTMPLNVVSPAKSQTHLDPTKKYALLVLSGVNPGQVIPVETDTVTIGRSGCSVLLDDAEISRRHAVIRIDGDEATIEDLGSTNGTFVEDKKVKSATIVNRSKFRVGLHELAFVVTDR